MIRIIKEGNYKRITCETCGAVLAYNQKEDVIERVGLAPDGRSCVLSHVECPLCGHHIYCGSRMYSNSLSKEDLKDKCLCSNNTEVERSITNAE